MSSFVAEYVQVTRATIDNVRFLRKAIAPVLTDNCAHVNGEGYECAALAVVVNLEDDAGYCLRHHRKAEAAR